MSEPEAKQQRRFVFERDRHQYLVCRGLIRYTLSRYAPVAPADWQFSYNNYGRPEVLRGLCDLPLRFNLSHTRGMGVLAITLSQDIGVDVEDTNRGDVGIHIADRYFSPREVADLRALPASQQPRTFFDYWTLKESYIKGRGMGLSLPLDKFSFELRHQPPSIDIEPELNDPPTDWQFRQFNPNDRHLVALAVRAKELPLRIEFREAFGC
jgi:4'-phosphopantetheinyl transferase